MSEQKYRLLDESDIGKPIPEGAEFYFLVDGQWRKSCLNLTCKFNKGGIGRYRIPVKPSPIQSIASDLKALRGRFCELGIVSVSVGQNMTIIRLTTDKFNEMFGSAEGKHSIGSATRIENDGITYEADDSVINTQWVEGKGGAQ